MFYALKTFFGHKRDNIYAKWVCYSLFLWRKSKKTQYFKCFLKDFFFAFLTMQLDFVVFFLANSSCPKECGKIMIFHPLALKWALQGTRRGFCI